jgi:tRNA pseudouridine65 synthase
LGRRKKETTYCQRCRVPEASCFCSELKPVTLETHLALVSHSREMKKTTATGPLALALLNNSRLYIHGLRHEPLNLTHLHDEGRRVLVLFPDEDAPILSPALREKDSRPITLVVPDGNWRQASRIPLRVPGLQNAELVALPPGNASQWGLRRETRPGGLATFEAIARAIGILESAANQEELENIFSRYMAIMLNEGRASHNPDSFATKSTAQKKPSSSGNSNPEAPDIPILFQDQHLIAINKPAGISVHRGWDRDDCTVLQYLRDLLNTHLYPVHRLDRATSGVLIVALRSKVARLVQEHFAAGQVHKSYIALCRGQDPNLGRVEHPLTKVRGTTEQEAITELRRLATWERYGLYEARPLTGRTHQIRRHLKHLSHPIIGDVRYGKGEHNRFFREHFGFHRLALHCRKMSFPHPDDGRTIDIVAPLSEDFAQLLHRLELNISDL